MKIVLIGNSDLCIYANRYELITRLLSEGHTVTVLSPYGKLIDELTKLGCDFYETKIERHGKNPFHDLKLLNRYRSILKKIKPQCVFTYTIKPNIYGAIACRKFHIPCISNITGLGIAIENGGLLQKITALLYKFAFKNIQTVFFQNEDNMQFFINKKIAIGKGVLLPGSGVNLVKNFYVPYPSASKKCRFLFVGRLMRTKGFSEYVEAAKIISQEFIDVEFVAIGFCEPEYQNALSTLHASKYIKMCGAVSNVHEHIANCHVVVLPSYHEGMANCLLEAAATGRPVIATTVPGCRETFNEGISGFGVKPQSVDSLVQAMRKFLFLSYEEKKNMGIYGRKKMEEEFDRNIIVDAYLRELKKVQKCEEPNYVIV